MAEIRVGTSGWSYPHWRKRFYPEKLPAREHFTFYASHFDTVELNNSFYRQPTRERFEAWAGQSPEGFVFAVKGSRYVTHIKRLAVEQESVDRVVEAARGLGTTWVPSSSSSRGTSSWTWSAWTDSCPCSAGRSDSRSSSATPPGSVPRSTSACVPTGSRSASRTIPRCRRPAR